MIEKSMIGFFHIFTRKNYCIKLIQPINEIIRHMIRKAKLNNNREKA